MFRVTSLRSNARYDTLLTCNRDTEANRPTRSHLARSYASNRSQLVRHAWEYSMLELELYGLFLTPGMVL